MMFISFTDGQLGSGTDAFWPGLPQCVLVCTPGPSCLSARLIHSFKTYCWWFVIFLLFKQDHVWLEVMKCSSLWYFLADSEILQLTLFVSLFFSLLTWNETHNLSPQCCTCESGPLAPAVWLGCTQLSIRIHLKAARHVCLPATALHYAGFFLENPPKPLEKHSLQRNYR